MSTQRDGVNPLRPYYIPPTIGDPSDKLPKSNPKPFSSGGNQTGNSHYASKARDMFSDLDYNDYISDNSPSVVQNVKDLLDELLWKYTSVLMAQPFEVAKTILQVRSQDENAGLLETPAPEPEVLKKRTSTFGSSTYDFPDSDSEGEEPAYFSSNVPTTPNPWGPNAAPAAPHSPSPVPSPTPVKKPVLPEHVLNLRRPDSILDVIGQLWQKEGAWGVWKGSNATFLYTILQSLLENWSRSFLSAIFNVPDLGVKDDIDRLIDIASPYPWASLFVAVTAAVTTGVLLSPLDLVRTRLIVTPSAKGPRRTLSTLRSLPSYVCDTMLILPTILNSLIHPVLTLSTPLVLRTRFMIDSRKSPTTFSVAKFMASSVAILIKLPIETVLRRGQVALLSSQEYLRALGGPEHKFDMIVPPGRYNGAFGTMYHIVTEEGRRELLAKPATAKKGRVRPKASTPTYKKGQGLDGLWRGWKVNWWGLVGLWTASLVGTGGEGEF